MSRTQDPTSAHYDYWTRRSQPLRRVCPRCDGLGIVTVEVIEPSTGRIVATGSITCQKCKGKRTP